MRGGNIPFKQGSRGWLCQTAGAAAPSGGRALHEVSDRGGYKGRFAPSPTGPLHAGSLVAALASWLDARAHGGQWLVRIEDIDTPRCVPGADRVILQQLAACGLYPDAPPVYQSQRHALYQAALDRLIATSLAYPCGCTRQDIARVLAAGGLARERHGELVYPGTCRNGLHGRQARAWRFLSHDIQSNAALATVPAAQSAMNSIANRSTSSVARGAAETRWWDRRLGTQTQQVSAAVGDFVLKRADGLWAYQLAVVTDDADQGISHVVRGEDLADNTARQILLQQALGLAQPVYLHTPLVLGLDGEKLSKQNGAQALGTDQPLALLQAAGLALEMHVSALSVPDWLSSAVHQWQQRAT